MYLASVLSNSHSRLKKSYKPCDAAVQDPSAFRAPTLVTGFVWGPLSFNSASGNGTTVGPGWGSPFFGVPSAVTSLVCGPLLFNSASGNGTTVGHGWGSPCCGSTQWLFCTKALHRPVFALFAGWEAALPFQVPEASATPVVINARLFLLVLQFLFVRHVKALCRSQPGGLSMLGTQRVADGRSLQKNASM